MPADVRELQKLARDLRRAGRTAEDKAAAVVIKVAADIEADAKRLCPVDTGHLRNSISREFSPDFLAAEVGPTANYGAHVEFGTWKQAPQPYMMPAADRHLPRFEKALGQILDRLL